MKPYLRIRENGEFATQSIAFAKEGFDILGIQTATFTHISQVPLSKGNMIVGFVNEVRGYLAQLGISTPDIDYPEELTKYLGRKIKKIAINNAEIFMNENSQQRYFIKPVIDKQFDAFIAEYLQDLARLKHFDKKTKIWISEYMKFESEFRCYIYNKKPLAICKYRGYAVGEIDYSIVLEMAETYVSAPVAYTLDVGLFESKLYLVEVNDAYSVQNYGLAVDKYVAWLMLRWSELSGQEVKKCFVTLNKILKGKK